MRKLLAVLMTVLMLASALAIIPVAATETESDELKYTGDAKGLLISEILHNSSCFDEVSGDGFEYWELYNAGTETLNIFDYSLVKAPVETKQPAQSSAYYDVWDIWTTEKKFVHKVDIKTNAVPVDANGKNAAVDSTGMPVDVPYKLQNNAEQGEIKPGEFAIVWFIKQASLNAFAQYMLDNEIASADALDPREVFIKQYSSLNNGFTVDSDLKIFIVWGYKDFDSIDGTNKPCKDSFGGSDGSKTSGAMYGIVKNTFDLNSSAVVDGKISSDVIALAPYAGAVDSWTRAKSNQGCIYVPSTTKPEYYIANRVYDERPMEDAEKVDYVTAGLADAYIEAGCVHSSAVATPGAFDKLQWALAYPDKAPANISGGQSGWAAAYISEYLTTIFPADGEVEDANDEEFIKITPPDRNKLQEIFFPSEENQYEEITRLSLVGKILIAVGAVVVVGAGAGAAVIVIKKKKA